MRYPKDLKIIVDITKPPYCADNTGKTDCTAALQKAVDDIIMRSVELFDETFEKLSGHQKVKTPTLVSSPVAARQS